MHLACTRDGTVMAFTCTASATASRGPRFGSSVDSPIRESPNPQSALPRARPPPPYPRPGDPRTGELGSEKKWDIPIEQKVPRRETPGPVRVPARCRCPGRRPAPPGPRSCAVGRAPGLKRSTTRTQPPRCASSLSLSLSLSLCILFCSWLLPRTVAASGTLTTLDAEESRALPPQTRDTHGCILRRPASFRALGARGCRLRGRRDWS